MQENMKKQYVPCQLDVVEFKVERGFASSGFLGSPMGEQGTTNMLWSMSDQNGHYKNEQYEEQIWTWVDSQNNLPGSN